MAHDRTLIQIRERGFLDLLDLALVVIRTWPVTIMLASLAGILPFAILNAWYISSRADDSLFWLGPLLILEIPWATAPLTLVLGGLLFGERPRVGRLLRGLLRSLPAMLFSQLLVRAVLLATIIFAPIIVARLAFLNEVILLERAGGFRAIRRSSGLCRLRELELLGRSLGLFLLCLIFFFCFYMGVAQLAIVVIDSDEGWYEPSSSGMLDFRAQAALWICVAFMGIVRFLAYIDQRIRLEGWAVELNLREAGRTLENSLA